MPESDGFYLEKGEHIEVKGCFEHYSQEEETDCLEYIRQPYMRIFIIL